MYHFKLHSNGVLAIWPKNKLLLAETLKSKEQWRSHQRGIGDADVFALPLAWMLEGRITQEQLSRGHLAQRML